MPKKLPETYQNLVRVIGMEATLQLCREYGGSVLYIPKLDRLQSTQRLARIRAEWTGRNNEALARKYGVSTRWVQKAVEGMAEPPLPGQVTLEDLPELRNASHGKP